MTEVQFFELPRLEDIQIKNPSTPLYAIFWSHLNQLGFEIRQELSKPIKDGGIDRKTNQDEVTERGILSIKMNIPYNKDTQFSGVKALIIQTMNIVNLKLYRNPYPLKELKLCRTNRDLLCYYGTCYHENIETVIYIGSWDDVDASDFEKRKRSEVINRNWKILAQLLSETISIEEIQ
jgi:hypothetical protein